MLNQSKKDLDLFQSFTASFHQLPPKHPTTIHQRALGLLWISALLLCVLKFFISKRNGHKSDPEEQKGHDHHGNTDANTVVKITIDQEGKPVSKPTTSTAPPAVTLHEFLFNVMCLGLILFYFYLCDYVHHFPSANRTYSRDFFAFLMILLLSISGFFTSRDTPDKILNRDQTEEWRGWMQVIFVWYHYFKAAEVYNMVRILIAAYVWMTGFGNFSFFWVRRDFSLYRVLKMLFRLNFLVILVCAVTDNEYMLYYICAMHTFWFLSVYCLMAIKPSWNNSPLKMAAKFTIYFIIDVLLFDCPKVGEFVFRPLWFIFSYQGSLHEWMFRGGLDHFMTFTGMLCAYFYPNFESFLSSLESKKQSFFHAKTGLIIKICIGGILSIVFTIWYQNVYILSKYPYNVLHPYTSFIPVLTYIFFRNISSKLRKKYVWLLAWLGKITLETYISQLHIYMQSDAKDLIVYIPDYPILNFTLASVIYIFCSYHLFHITVNISSYVLPNDFKLMGRRLAIGGLWWACCYCFAWGMYHGL